MLREQYLSFVPQTLHLKTPDGAMAYLLRFLLKNAVMLSNGILSIRSYKSTWVAFLQSAALLADLPLHKPFWRSKANAPFTMDEQDRARRNFLNIGHEREIHKGHRRCHGP